MPIRPQDRNFIQPTATLDINARFDFPLSSTDQPIISARQVDIEFIEFIAGVESYAHVCDIIETEELRTYLILGRLYDKTALMTIYILHTIGRNKIVGCRNHVINMFSTSCLDSGAKWEDIMHRTPN